MTTEQQPSEDGKVEVTVKFHILPVAVKSNPVIVAAQSEWADTLSKTLTKQMIGRVNREGVFTEAQCASPVFEVKEGDEKANGVSNLIDQWVAALVGETPASLPEMELSPEMVQQVRDAVGVDLSHYVVTDIQYTAPHVFNITLR